MYTVGERRSQLVKVVYRDADEETMRKLWLRSTLDGSDGKMRRGGITRNRNTDCQVGGIATRSIQFRCYGQSSVAVAIGGAG